ncbi:MAG: response regulator [Cyanobacteria bacterium P01_F01_bin.53]
MNLEPFNTTEALSSLKILLAEDNLVNQQLAVMMLKRLGYQTDAISGGEDVLQALQNNPYDVILMDVHMPGMSGITATQKRLSDVSSRAKALYYFPSRLFKSQ